MYRLLIVDDEASVVDSLALTIPWEDLGIEDVLRAYSAEEALQMATKQAIDVMITDIRMPEMDGLELIERIRHYSRKIRCIILSGHDEFEYAQKAIQYQTTNYLLKPVDIHILIQSVREAIEQIEREWTDISSYQRIKHILHANKPMLRNQLLNELLQNKPIHHDSLEERLAMLDLPFRIGDTFVMMVIRMEEDFSGYDLHSLSLIEFAVGNIAEEVFQAPYQLWQCNTEQGYLVCLIKSEDMEALPLVDDYAVHLQTHVQKFLKGSLSICLSDIRKFPDGLSGVYQTSVSAIHRNVGLNKSYFITVDASTTTSDERHMINMYEPPFLPSLLASGKWEEAIAKISRMLLLSDPDREPSHDQLFTALLYLASSFSMSFASTGKSVEEQLGDEFNLLLRKQSHLSRQRIFDWAERMIQFLKSTATHQMEDSHQQIVAKVHTFIQEHLAEGITLQSVADHVKLHFVYLSKVYKTVTGQTIGEYIYQIRMDRAAHLLQSTDMKIADVSAQLGFLAPPHFIKIFKKHYGCTPQEYRNR